MSNSFTWEWGVVIMLECIVVLSLYPEMQKQIRVFSFGNFKELNHKTPTFMYCFFKLSGYAVFCKMKNAYIL